MSKVNQLAIIGAGNVGSYLLKSLQIPNWYVRGYNRTEKPGFQPLDHLERDLDSLDLLLICVSDDAIAKLTGKIPASNAIVAHVSGATSLSTIDSKHTRPAVFYPLMSIRPSNEVAISKIPFCLETGNKEDFVILANLVTDVGATFYEVNSQQRTYLHLAAVLSQNFTNHLHFKAWKLLSENGMDFTMLLPLLTQSLGAIQGRSPAELQTGPAIRGDVKTINKHMELLKSTLDKDIYRLLSKSIQES